MKTILLAEDDSMISDIYKRKFQEAGFDVTVASSGKDVLHKVSETTFDVILLDLVLPDMQGLDVLKEIRSNNADIRVIIFSNITDQETRQAAIELGADGFIEKADYTPSRLVAEIDRFIKQFDEQLRNYARIDNIGDVSDSNAQRKKILLIEDEDVFLDMFSRKLRDEGYEVTLASSGSDGLEKAMNNVFDLIVTDMIMPGMTGEELIKRLKEEGRLGSTKTILFSASVEEESLEHMQSSGLVDKCFLKTKVTPTDIAHEARELLGE